MVMRHLEVLRALAGNTAHGLTPGEIGQATRAASASAITQDLARLLRAGWAEEARSPGRYRLGPMLVQIALQHEREMVRVLADVAEIKQRYSRKAA